MQVRTKGRWQCYDFKVHLRKERVGAECLTGSLLEERLLYLSL